MSDPITEARNAVVEAAQHAGIICYRLRESGEWFPAENTDKAREMFLVRFDRAKQALREIDHLLKTNSYSVRFGSIGGETAHHVALRLCSLICCAISRDLKNGETPDRIRGISQADIEELIGAINNESAAMQKNKTEPLKVTLRNLEYITHKCGKCVPKSTMEKDKARPKPERKNGTTNYFLYSECIEWLQNRKPGLMMPDEEMAREWILEKKSH